MNVSGVTCKEYIDLMNEYGYECYKLTQGGIGERVNDFINTSSVDLISVIFKEK